MGGHRVSASSEGGELLPMHSREDTPLTSLSLPTPPVHYGVADASPPDSPTGSSVLAGVKEAYWRDLHGRKRSRKIIVGATIVIAGLMGIIGEFGSLKWEGVVTIGVLCMDLVLMSLSYPPDAVFLVSTCMLQVLGCVDSAGAFEGFSNQGVLSIGVLFAVAQGLYETGGIELLMRHALGSPTSVRMAITRCCIPVMVLSAFLANTPVVAMMIPLLVGWAERIGVSPSKLLMPLSYASVVGGTCTIIGSSVNLIAANAAIAQPDGPERVSMFDQAPIGIAQMIVGVLYIALMGPVLLPDRQGDAQKREARVTRHHQRKYSITFVVSGKPIAGSSFDDSGINRIPGGQLQTIVRSSPGADQNAEVGTDKPLLAGDLLTFSATARAVCSIRQQPGMGQHGEMAVAASVPRRRYRMLAECVCGPRCRLLSGRGYEGAHVIAVEEGAASGDRPSAGDAVLVECFPDFVSAYHTVREHFVLLAPVPHSKPPRVTTTKDNWRMWGAAFVAVAMVAVKTAFDDDLPLTVAAALALQCLITMQCLTWSEAWAAVDGRLLACIACAFGISNAMEQSGAAEYIADGLVSVAKPGGKIALMAAVYLCTVLIGAVISNNAVVLLMTPIAFAARRDLADDHNPTDDPLGWTLLIIFGGSSCFLTPISYQTNLMVWGPGGYSFADFPRFGFGLTLLLFVIGTGGPYLVAERLMPF
eukprot:TRINITY_DN35622_c0_g1_i1.p1 TRINITY_DN35622_c0_g1~~TRINITY_DN35622_c0_g1_i1.p1  ORF type:complete len:701 (+),score=145.32 TRINITY_DN35622_c0_g1_i1:54-2156(+)